MTPRAGEPAWTDDDVEYALQWQEFKDSLCPGCGQPRDESFSAGMADSYAVTLRRCHACAAQGREVEAQRKEFDDWHGMYSSVSPDHREH